MWLSDEQLARIGVYADNKPNSQEEGEERGVAKIVVDDAQLSSTLTALRAQGRKK